MLPKKLLKGVIFEKLKIKNQNLRISLVNLFKKDIDCCYICKTYRHPPAIFNVCKHLEENEVRLRYLLPVHHFQL